MDTIDWIAAGSVTYIVGTFALHRARVGYARSIGMESRLLERLDKQRIPQDAAVLSAVEALEGLRRTDYGAVERQARAVRGLINKGGGVKASAARAYLDAHVRLKYLTSAVNLELSALGAMWAIRQALRRFGPTSELHLVRAHAQSLLGNNDAALDDLGRALYYSGNDRFYSELVAESGFVERARPKLRQEALARLG